MAKPSIFSKDYKRKMRKIRRRRLFISILLIFILGSGFIYFQSNFKFHFVGINKFKNSINNKKNVNNDSKLQKPDNKIKVVPKEDVPKVIEKDYTVQLSDGKELKAIYEENSGEKKFIKLINSSTDSDKFSYSINPSGKGIIIYDAIVQNIIYLDINGNKLDITKKTYTAQSNGDTYIKEDILANKANYIWDKSPTFIDDQNVAYISQLPWFNSEDTKYLWIVNVNSPEKHDLFENINGRNIEFGKIDSKGLTIVVDEKTKYIDGTGKISE